MTPPQPLRPEPDPQQPEPTRPGADGGGHPDPVRRRDDTEPDAPLPADGSSRRTALADLVHSLDDRVDGWFEPWRGNPAVDGAAKVITGLGDHGLMWAVTTVWRARHSGPERARSVRALAIAGVESSVVNAALKAAIGRARPDRSGVRLAEVGVPVREPKTTSFPSGHTLAAFCSATVMSLPDDRAGNALLYTGAALVGLSRLHLRAHHASDVLGGAAVGTALGLLGRRLL
ncbi:MAG: phosphatase PAP2 family protein [Acidimicrobiales bacterium]|jgi:undecaprenyl-diphosphatase